jgi:hypothetical protein
LGEVVITKQQGTVLYRTRDVNRDRLNVLLKIYGLFDSAGEIGSTVQTDAFALRLRVHVCDPVAVENSYVGVAFGIMVSLGALLDVLVDLSIRKVACGVGTYSWSGSRVGPVEQAFGAGAAGVGHAERPTIARDAGNHFAGRHTRLGDHSKGVLGFREIDAADVQLVYEYSSKCQAV